MMYFERIARLSLIIACLTAGTAVMAQFGIIPSRDGKTPVTERTMSYFLPLHEVVVNVGVVRETFIPGRFSEYADDLLGLQDVSRRESTTYSMLSVNLSVSTEPDTEHRYFLPRSDARKTGEDVVLFNGNGVISYYGRSSFAGRNAGAHDHAAPASGAWVSLNEPPESIPFGVEKEIDDTPFPSVDTQDSTHQRTPARKSIGSRNERDLAREAASKVIELREARLRLLSGYQEVEYSKDAMAFMDQGLREAYDEYLNLFTGTLREERGNYSYRVVPGSANDSIWVPLFRFSDSEGIFGLEGTKGEVVYLRWTAEPGRPVRDYVPPAEGTTLPEPGPTLWYRIPALTSFELRIGNEILFRGQEHISQLGQLQGISVNKLSLEFDPVTGEPVKVIFDN